MSAFAKVKNVHPAVFGISILIAFVALGAFLLASVSSAPSTSQETSVSTVEKEEETITHEGSSGFGMTYNGKMGIDLGGGLVMPMNGGTPQMGFGF